MEILILNWKDINHPQVGGAEIIVYEIAKRMIRDGHKITWFTRSFNGAKPKEIIDGINIIRRGNLFSVYFHAPFYYFCLKKKPDIVIDMSNTIYWQTPIWVRKTKRIAYLNQLAKEVFDYEYTPIIAFFGKLVERLQYLTYRGTPFACYSESTKKDLISYGIPDKNIQLFFLGLDHSRYKQRIKSKTPLFLCVSRLVKMKRTDLVIRAFDIVRKTHPEAKLCIMGYGYERDRLEKLRDDLKLHNNVFFQDEDILYFEKDVKDKKVKMMQESWALIFPSVKEGWGMTVTECAACGTPSIVTDVTGLRDSVVKDKTGILLSKKPDPQEIATAIIKLIEDDKLRKELSKNCKEWAKKFTWEKSYEGFMEILRNTKER